MGGRQGFVLPALLLLLGVTLAAALAQERGREAMLPAQARQLAALVRARREQIADLEAQLRRLSKRLEATQESQAQGSERAREILEEIDRAAGPAGVAPGRGPGVIVELEDSREAPSSLAEASDLRIQDVDLRLVVNALWSGGARAVAVNGHRVGSTTAIRTAGDAILVNFRAVRSPYRVTAIGDPDALREALSASEIAQQFEVWTEVYGLGYSVRTAGDVTVPGFEGAPDLEWAAPAGEP